MHALLCDQRQTVPPVARADLTGKTVMVIGANIGLGFEATKHFARMKPARLILACRSEAKAKAAIQGMSARIRSLSDQSNLIAFSELEKDTGYQGAEVRTVDLSNFKSVQDFANGIEEEDLALDIMVYNSAVLMNEHQETADGWEQTYALVQS